MVEKIEQWRVFCATENTYKYPWSETKPTACPTDSAHTIIPESINAVAEMSKNIVHIAEESTPTGGWFASCTMAVDANPGETGTNAMFFPFPTTVLTAEFTTTDAQKGDTMDLSHPFERLIGAIASVVSPAPAWSAQTYTVNQSVTYTHPDPVIGTQVYTCVFETAEPPLIPLSNEVHPHWHQGYHIAASTTNVTDILWVGFHITLTDGVNKEYLGRVLGIHKEDGHFFVERNPTQTFSPLSPTYILLSVYTFKDYEIGTGSTNQIGEGKIGGSYMPANTVIRVHYRNNGTAPVHQVGRVEYLY